jgi:hypothetical protein
MCRSAKHDGQLHNTLTSLMEASLSYSRWAAQAAPSAGAASISQACLISFLTFVDSCATYYAASGLPDTLISHVMLGSPAINDTGAYAGDDGNASCGRGDMIHVTQSANAAGLRRRG